MVANILVIDDDTVNTFVVSTKIKKLGHDVCVINNPLEYEETLLSFKPDVILLDIVMPGKSGIEVLKEIRVTTDRSDLPIIMMTAKNTSKEISEALDFGANDFLTKPFDIRVLVARLNVQLEQLNYLAVESEKKRLEAVNTMIVSYNHEINNPLTIAMGNLGLAKAKLGESPHLDKIESSLERISKVVKEIKRVASSSDFATEDYFEGSKMLKLKK